MKILPNYQTKIWNSSFEALKIKPEITGASIVTRLKSVGIIPLDEVVYSGKKKKHVVTDYYGCFFNYMTAQQFLELQNYRGQNYFFLSGELTKAMGEHNPFMLLKGPIICADEITTVEQIEEIIAKLDAKNIFYLYRR